MSVPPATARKIVLIPAERPRPEAIRRYRIARVETPTPREARFEHLKRMYD